MQRRNEGKKMGNDYRRLMRSRTNRTICGVCGGIGDYLNVDPVLIRLIWAICTLISCGTGVVVYLIAALIMPEDDGIVG